MNVLVSSYLIFPTFHYSWDNLGGIRVLGVLQTCCVTLTAAATCTVQKIRVRAALTSWDWCTNILFTALTGFSDMSLSIWLIFPSAADSSFYTKIKEWVFLVRKMRLFRSCVTFVLSSWIPLPRNSDILVKKDWKPHRHNFPASLYSCLLALTNAQKQLLHEESTRQQLFAHAITVIVYTNQVGLYANGQ